MEIYENNGKLKEILAHLEAKYVQSVWAMARLIAAHPHREERAKLIVAHLAEAKKADAADVDMEYMSELAGKFAAKPTVAERARLIGNLFEQLRPSLKL